MYNFEYYFSIYLFMFSCFMYAFFSKHLMLMIISMEFIMISLCYNMFILMMMLEGCFYLLLFFLIMSVCESVLVLCLVVLLVRFTGNDYLNLLNLIKW